MKKSKKADSIIYTIFPTPLGNFTAAAHCEKMVYMSFGDDINQLIAWCDEHLPGVPAREDTSGASPILKEAERQVIGYLEGDRTTLELPYIFMGTIFQKITWEAIRRIPRGETRSYGDIARDIEHPLAARAVGNACNKNPLALIIPCQRVVASSGIGGYGTSGLTLKTKLLKIDSENKTGSKTAALDD